MADIYFTIVAALCLFFDIFFIYIFNRSVITGEMALVFHNRREAIRAKRSEETWRAK